MAIITTVLELIGAASVTFGVYLLDIPAALMVGGALLVAFSFGLTTSGRPGPR